jgi:UDP-N-acetylglucosamine diphosphorylase/glucosamine-1-phosphate N-acetyltransferase
MPIILFDNEKRNQLYPLTATRAVADLRFGIVTIKERWEIVTKQIVFVRTEKYLQPLYAGLPDGENIWIDASVIADEKLIEAILQLQSGEALIDAGGLIATKATNTDAFDKTIRVDIVKRITYPWNLFQWNDEMLRKDFELITKGRTSHLISSTNHIYAANNIFIEEGASVEFATLNSKSGPIYIGKNAEVWETSVIRGPFAIKENAVIKAGAKMYGATTIGPWCAAGGEIKNAVIMGYSNKAHDGYLGDAVIGHWCNFGAGSSNSNVKNTGGDVYMQDYITQQKVNAGIKCGVIMGDYSRVAINSSVNTGSVIGVSANVFGAGLLPKIIDDFSWGTSEEYEFDKAVRDIDNWKRMKHQQVSDMEVEVLKHIFAAKN